MTTLTLHDGVTLTTDPRLDRVRQFDERSRNYSVQDLDTLPPRSYTWTGGPVLDQGSEGACVGHAWTADATARPHVVPASQADAFAVYREAQRLDPWPGETPEYEGTSTLAGAKAAKARGWIIGYRWTFTLEAFILALGYRGPVVLGLDWHVGMMYPSATGRIRATGDVVGGHCILARGIRLVWKAGTTRAQKRDAGWLAHLDLDASYVTLRQSWGIGHGKLGDVTLSLADLQMLLRAGGESCVPVRK